MLVLETAIIDSGEIGKFDWSGKLSSAGSALTGYSTEPYIPRHLSWTGSITGIKEESGEQNGKLARRIDGRGKTWARSSGYL